MATSQLVAVYSIPRVFQTDLLGYQHSPVKRLQIDVEVDVGVGMTVKKLREETFQDFASNYL